MFTASFGITFTFASVSMQCGQDNESDYVETESGTGNKSVSNQLPVFAKKLFAHCPTQITRAILTKWDEMSRVNAVYAVDFSS